MGRGERETVYLKLNKGCYRVAPAPPAHLHSKHTAKQRDHQHTKVSHRVRSSRNHRHERALRSTSSASGGKALAGPPTSGPRSVTTHGTKPARWTQHTEFAQSLGNFEQNRHVICLSTIKACAGRPATEERSGAPLGGASAVRVVHQ